MDDLLAEFIAEINENLAVLETDLARLQGDPDNTALLCGIFRTIHTIKGSGRFIGLPRLDTIAHKAEDVLELFRNGTLEVTPDYIGLIYACLDRIRQIVNTIAPDNTESQGDDTALIAQLDAVLAQAVTHTAQHPVHHSALRPSAVQTGHGHSHSHSHSLQEKVVHSMRIPVDKLQDILAMVQDLAVTRSALLQIAHNSQNDAFTAPLQRLDHIVTDLQHALMQTHRQPIGNIWSELPAIIRGISHDLGKTIDFTMTGQDIMLDRRTLGLIKDPLRHIVLNSADHGIEAPQERIAAGKAETGTITLSASSENGHIIIKITDDGRGLPLAKIKDKILSDHLLPPEDIDALSVAELQQFIFKPGFSTAAAITPVSGRGVGMDILQTNINKAGGVIELDSIEGCGTSIVIKIPVDYTTTSAPAAGDISIKPGGGDNS